MKWTPKIFVYGFLTWLVPFLFSFLFVGEGGAMRIDQTLFKSIMVVVGASVGIFYLVNYFRDVNDGYVKVAIAVGLLWLAINLGLDLILVVVGFFPYTISAYFTDIGIRYLVIPIFAYGIGVSLQHQSNR
jgi:hypothetical protein